MTVSQSTLPAETETDLAMQAMLHSAEHSFWMAGKKYGQRFQDAFGLMAGMPPWSEVARAMVRHVVASDDPGEEVMRQFGLPEQTTN